MWRFQLSDIKYRVSAWLTVGVLSCGLIDDQNLYNYVKACVALSFS
jgi:hypothetical protein